MSDITISYKGSSIATMDASGTKTLLTEGKYCEDDIEVVYDKPSGEVYYQSPTTGAVYKKVMDVTIENFSRWSMGGSRYAYCNELEEFTLRGVPMFQENGNVVSYCPKLKRAIFPDFTDGNNTYIARDCPLLEEIQIGSIGKAKSTSFYASAFSGSTNANLVITIYVADDATLPYANSPWGATNATVVYRSATTGEVITV